MDSYKNAGKNFNKRLDIIEIAKNIKRDVKSQYGDVKISSTTQRYAGGRSIRITINDVQFNPYSEDVVKYGSVQKWWDAIGNKTDDNRYNSWYLQLRQDIEDIMNSYNYNDSDSQSDYFDVNFYGSVNLDDVKMHKKYLKN